MATSKYTEVVEFDVTDAFGSLKKVRRLNSGKRAIYSVHMITCTRIVVKFDNRKIQAKDIVKATRQRLASDQQKAA